MKLAVHDPYDVYMFMTSLTGYPQITYTLSHHPLLLLVLTALLIWKLF